MIFYLQNNLIIFLWGVFMIKKTSLWSSFALGSLLALSLTQSAKAAVFDCSWNNSGGTFSDNGSRDSETGDGLSASGTITLDDAVGDGGSFTIADVTAYSIEVFNGTTSLFTFTDANSANFAGSTSLPTFIQGTLSGDALSFSRFAVTTAQNLFGCSVEFTFSPNQCFSGPYLAYDNDGSSTNNANGAGTNAVSLGYEYGTDAELYASFEATLQPAESVPEPTTILGLVAVGLGLVASKRKKR